MGEKNTAALFDTMVHYRRAVRQFDQEEIFDQALVRRSLERAVLSPNSSNANQRLNFYTENRI